MASYNEMITTLNAINKLESMKFIVNGLNIMFEIEEQEGGENWINIPSGGSPLETKKLAKDLNDAIQSVLKNYLINLRSNIAEEMKNRNERISESKKTSDDLMDPNF